MGSYHFLVKITVKKETTQKSNGEREREENRIYKH